MKAPQRDLILQKPTNPHQRENSPPVAASYLGGRGFMRHYCDKSHRKRSGRQCSFSQVPFGFPERSQTCAISRRVDRSRFRNFRASQPCATASHRSEPVRSQCLSAIVYGPLRSERTWRAKRLPATADGQGTSTIIHTAGISKLREHQWQTALQPCSPPGNFPKAGIRSSLSPPQHAHRPSKSRSLLERHIQRPSPQHLLR